MIRQLLPGMLSTIPGGKIAWGPLPVAPHWTTSSVEMDWATWVPRAYMDGQRPVAAFLDIEATTHNVEDQEDYVPKKILQLARVLDANGGLASQIGVLRSNPRYAGFPLLPTEHENYLLIVSNKSARLSTDSVIRAFLKGTKGSLAGSHPDFDCTPTNTRGSAYEVTTPSGKKIHLGLIGADRLTELSYLAFALNQSKRHELVDERFLFELTSSADCPLLLDAMPTTVSVTGLAPGAPLRIEGKTVTLHRFTIDPFAFLRMATVLRLVSDYSYLQRLPDGNRLAEMGMVIESGDRFPTPVLCLPPDSDAVEERQSLVRQSGGAAVSAYRWHLIDGQHRVFCYYFIEPGRSVQSIDVNSYTLSNPPDRASIASSLFLDVNFKAERPSEDLGLSYYAFMNLWPQGSWIPKKGRGRAQRGSKDFFSARILASRFLLELNIQDTIFKDFFKAVGARDSGKVSIKALSTYLSGDFDLQSPDDRASAVACRYGTVAGAGHQWSRARPAPGQLDRLWTSLVDHFDDFCSAIAVTSPGGLLGGQSDLRRLIKKNNNVFVALWKAFHQICLKGGTGSTLAAVSPKKAARALKWLLVQESKGYLTGTTNKYKSGTGSTSLPLKLIKLLE